VYDIEFTSGGAKAGNVEEEWHFVSYQQISIAILGNHYHRVSHFDVFYVSKRDVKHL
jgi:hypothetical protein